MRAIHGKPARSLAACCWRKLCAPAEMIRAARWSLGANATLAAAGALTGVLTARLLGPVGRGQLAVVMLWPAMLSNLAATGLLDAFGFYAGCNPIRAGALAKLALWCAAAQGAAASLLALTLFPLFLHHQGESVVRLSILFSLTAPVYIASGYLLNIVHASGRMRVWNALRLIAPLTYFAGVGLLALAGRCTVVTIVAAVALGHALAALATLTTLLQSADWSQPAAWDLGRPILSYGIKNLVAGIASLVNTRLDQLLMTWFLSSQQIGHYVAAVSFAGLLSAPAQALASLMLPGITRCAQLSDALAVVRSGIRGTLVLILPGAGLLLMAAPWLMVRLYGRAFEGGVEAAQILLIGGLAVGLNQVLYEALRALNQPLGVAVGETAGMAVSFLALWVLLPRLGINGAALASVASYSTICAVLAWHTKKTFASSRASSTVSSPGRPPAASQSPPVPRFEHGERPDAVRPAAIAQMPSEAGTGND